MIKWKTIFLHLNLFVSFAVLFTVVDFLFYVELLFVTSQYRLGSIHNGKHKINPTT